MPFSAKRREVATIVCPMRARSSVGEVGFEDHLPAIRHQPIFLAEVKHRRERELGIFFGFSCRLGRPF